MDALIDGIDRIAVALDDALVGSIEKHPAEQLRGLWYDILETEADARIHRVGVYHLEP